MILRSILRNVSTPTSHLLIKMILLLVYSQYQVIVVVWIVLSLHGASSSSQVQSSHLIRAWVVLVLPGNKRVAEVKVMSATFRLLAPSLWTKQRLYIDAMQ